MVRPLCAIQLFAFRCQALRLASPFCYWQSKDGGGTRLLGIPTVLDRLIQQTIAQVLMPLYDSAFSDHSYGFRPRRSAHGAIAKMAEEGKSKGRKCHVVD